MENDTHAAEWNTDARPDQGGRTVIVTGGSAGIGYFAAEQLAAAGATVILAVRSAEKAEAARAAIRSRHPESDVRSMPLDLSSLASIRAFGEAAGELDRVDAIVLNAAVMRAAVAGEATTDGFDSIMGTGHLGNAALIAATLPVLVRTPGSRIVGTTSGLVRRMRADLPALREISTPLRSAGPLASGTRYVQSKAAHEAFMLELDRRLRAGAAHTAAVLSHPGMAIDSRSPERPGVLRHSRAGRIREPLWGLIGVGKDVAAQSAVRAAIDPAVEGGQYWGPAGPIGGPPQRGRPDDRFSAPELGARVWRETEELIGVSIAPGLAPVVD